MQDCKKNICLVLAGQYRGTTEMVELHKKHVGEYDTYIACLAKYKKNWQESDWNPKEIFDVPIVDFKQTLWSKYRNDAPGESGFWQFYNLKFVLENVPKQYDFYIKSRNDLVIESELDIDFNNLDENTYYYSERTFTGIWPYINDQFWIGSKKVINVISKFVDEFYLTPGSEFVGRANEHMLSWWIAHNGIKTESFSNFLYSKNHNGITQSSGEVNKFFLE